MKTTIKTVVEVSLVILASLGLAYTICAVFIGNGYTSTWSSGQSVVMMALFLGIFFMFCCALGASND